MAYRFPCECCGKAQVVAFQTCPVCGWCDDYAQSENPDLRGGENKMSLNEARKAYREGKKVE